MATTNSGTLGTSARPEPRLLLTPKTDTGSAPSVIPYFVIDRNADGSTGITWILDPAVRLDNCIWITPSRNRIASDR